MNATAIAPSELPPSVDHAGRRIKVTIWFAWALGILSLAQFRSRHADELWEGGGIDAQVKFQILCWGLLFGLATVCVFTRRVDPRLLRGGPLGWYLAYVVVALMTTVISNSAPLTFFRAGQLIVTVVLVASMREYLLLGHWMVVAWIGVNFFFMAIANAGLHFGQVWLTGEDNVYLLSGTHEFEPWRFATAFGHPSIISICAAISGASILARARWEQWRSMLALLMFLTLCVALTSSRTGLVGAAAAWGVVAVGRRIGLPCLLAAGVLIPPVLMTPPAQQAIAKYLKRGQDDSELESLTGRDVIYAEAVKRIEESFPIGLGFQANRFQLISEEAGFVGITHSHNLFLESLVAMGVVGLILSIVILGSACWCIVVALGRYGWLGPYGTASLGLELVAMMLPIVAFSIMDRSYASPVGIDVFAYVVVFAQAQYAKIGATEWIRPGEDHASITIAGRKRPSTHLAKTP